MHGVINPLPIRLHASRLSKYEDNIVLLYFMVYLKKSFRVQTTCRRVVGGEMNDELERLWKEVEVAKFQILSWKIPGRTKETTKNLSRNSRCPYRSEHLRKTS